MFIYYYKEIPSMWQILNCNFVIHIVLRVGLMSKLNVCEFDRLI